LIIVAITALFLFSLLRKIANKCGCICRCRLYFRTLCVSCLECIQMWVYMLIVILLWFVVLKKIVSIWSCNCGCGLL